MLVIDDFGLDFEASTLTQSDADAAFLDAVRGKNRSSWTIGDLLNSGALSDQVIDACTLSQKTMANYASVCQRFPKRLRLVPVSQSHYESCSKLAAKRMDEALALLRAALDGGMDRNWVRIEAAKLLSEYVETVEILLVFRKGDGVFVPSPDVEWLPDGFNRTITARRE